MKQIEVVAAIIYDNEKILCNPTWLWRSLKVCGNFLVVK